METDPYVVLGVNPGASLADVRRAWRVAARQWHPDSGVTPDTNAFIRAKEAYALLRATAAADPAPAVKPRRVARPDTSGLPDHDPFRYQPAPTPSPGQDLSVDLLLAAAEAAAGGNAHVPVMYSLLCSTCNGQAPTVRCPVCNTAGFVPYRAAVRVFWDAGTGDGQRWRVPRAGAPGFGGGPPGDLFVTARVAG